MTLLRKGTDQGCGEKQPDTGIRERARSCLTVCGHIAEAVLLIIFAPLHLFLISAPFAAPYIRELLPITGGWSFFTGGLPGHTVEAANDELFGFLFFMWIVCLGLYLLYRLLLYLKGYALDHGLISMILDSRGFVAFPGILLAVWAVLPLGVFPTLAVFVVAALSCAVAMDREFT